MTQNQSAAERLLILRSDILTIEAQLSDRNRRHVDGTAFTPSEYSEWRASAIRALKTKQSQAKRLEAMIQAHIKIEEKVLLRAILSALCDGDPQTIQHHIDLASAMVTQEDSTNAFDV